MRSYLTQPLRAALLFLLLMLSVAAIPPVAAETDDGLDFLRGYLAELESLEADFRQQVVDRDGELIEEASGRVWVERPGKFRWNYETPFRRVIVTDGARVWLYEADLDQVTVRAVDAALGETPAALLSGEADILERFRYLDAGRRDSLFWITLEPRSPGADFESVRLGFDGDRLEQLVLADRLGQTTRLWLTGQRRNMEIDDEWFRFVVPQGADVIGESDL